MGFVWIHLVTIVGSSLVAAVLAIAGLSLSLRSRQQPRTSLFSDTPGGTVFLFDNRDLIDATEGARALLSAGQAGEDAWKRLMGFVIPRFPGFEARLAQIVDTGRFTLVSDGPRPLTLRAEWRGGLTRLALIDSREEGAPLPLDPISQRALEEEVDTLRGITEHAPLLVWRETGAGAVVWANRAYLMLAMKTDGVGEPLGWPLPRLFPALAFPAPPEGRPAAAQRAALPSPGQDRPLWYDCHGFDLGADRLIYALPADAAVQAETSLRSFIQTLTKTFAHLTIGLAIFDHQRRLALFNPALIDLTALSPEFLSARPTLFTFLDAMRERQMIPEPKDYKNWRAQMAALEKAAASGQYEETWTLPSGQTYRVTGRPHPDGAVAFLFEDISAEMTLTRRFRAELELGQAVIDSLGEAIAVFSSAGQMILSNAAYARLWNTQADSALADSGIAEVTGHWQSRCAPSPIWDRLRDFVGTVGERQGWGGEVRLVDGRALDCRFAPVAGGATLVGFSIRLPEQGAAAQAGAPARRSA